MKIALIGNTNNNNFAMMRYFRDLGADAHLLLYKNDGHGPSSHFRPEYDTWDIDKWSPYIHQTELVNGYASPLGDIPLYRVLLYIKYLFKTIRRRPERHFYVRTSTEYLTRLLCDYDRCIGSGLSPALLNRIGLSLDIFYPYSMGIEFLGSRDFVVRMTTEHLLSRHILERVAQAQTDGIRSARHCVNCDSGFTEQTFDKIGVKCLRLAIPMVYSLDFPRDEQLPRELLKLKAELKDFDLTAISPSRQMWVNPGHYSDAVWEQASKHNDWLIRSFAEFTRNRPNVNSLLLILEYGPDVDHTKRLCVERGIQDRVKWLPRMARRDLMHIISCCDVGVGEFYSSNVIWGGTGWEVLASGKPLLQGFRFKKGEFEAAYGYPPPPMLPVVSPDCILKHLIDMADHSDKREAIGKGGEEWFKQYNGIGLAKKWLDLLHTKNDDSHWIDTKVSTHICN